MITLKENEWGIYIYIYVRMCLLVSSVVPREPALRDNDRSEISLEENDSAEWTIGSSKVYIHGPSYTSTYEHEPTRVPNTPSCLSRYVPKAHYWCQRSRRYIYTTVLSETFHINIYLKK